ncbi:hypothetical protein [Galactobacter valiniphilus]|uniref:hypothetical protein n=1 Tax=Galactobacter valiniphilus TaxID=2676122 RepID=UPI003734E435
MAVKVTLEGELRGALPGALKREGLGEDAAGAWMLEAVRNVLELRAGLEPDVRSAVRQELARLPRWRETGTKPDQGYGVSWDYANPSLPGAVDRRGYEVASGLWRWAVAAPMRARLEHRVAWSRGPRPLLRFKGVPSIPDIGPLWREGNHGRRLPGPSLSVDVPEKEMERWQQLARLEGFPNLELWVATLAAVQLDLEGMARWQAQSVVLSGEAAPMVAVLRDAGQFMNARDHWEELKPAAREWVDLTLRLARVVAAVAA